MIAAAPTIKGAVGENLRQALDWLPTGRKLVTVRTDCDLSAQLPSWPALDALALREADRQGLLDFFMRFDFRSWRKELEDRRAVGAAPAVEATGRLPMRRWRATTRPCSRCEQLDDWLARIGAAELVALDTETDSLDAMRARDRRPVLRHRARRRGLCAAAA